MQSRILRLHTPLLSRIWHIRDARKFFQKHLKQLRLRANSGTDRVLTVLSIHTSPQQRRRFHCITIIVRRDMHPVTYPLTQSLDPSYEPRALSHAYRSLNAWTSPSASDLPFLALTDRRPQPASTRKGRVRPARLIRSTSDSAVDRNKIVTLRSHLSAARHAQAGMHGRGQYHRAEATTSAAITGC